MNKSDAMGDDLVAAIKNMSTEELAEIRTKLQSLDPTLLAPYSDLLDQLSPSKLVHAQQALALASPTTVARATAAAHTLLDRQRTAALDSARSTLHRAHTAAHEGQYRDAVMLYLEASDLASSSPDSDMRTRLLRACQLNAASSLLHLSRHRECIALCDEVLSEHANDVRALFYKGSCLLHLNAHDAALHCLRHAAQHAPSTTLYTTSTTSTTSTSSSKSQEEEDDFLFEKTSLRDELSRIDSKIAEIIRSKWEALAAKEQAAAEQEAKKKEDLAARGSMGPEKRVTLADGRRSQAPPPLIASLSLPTSPTSPIHPSSSVFPSAATARRPTFPSASSAPSTSIRLLPTTKMTMTTTTMTRPPYLPRRAPPPPAQRTLLTSLASPMQDDFNDSDQEEFMTQLHYINQLHDELIYYRERNKSNDDEDENTTPPTTSTTPPPPHPPSVPTTSLPVGSPMEIDNEDNVEDRIVSEAIAAAASPLTSQLRAQHRAEIRQVASLLQHDPAAMRRTAQELESLSPASIRAMFASQGMSLPPGLESDEALAQLVAQMQRVSAEDVAVAAVLAEDDRFFDPRTLTTTTRMTSSSSPPPMRRFDVGRPSSLLDDSLLSLGPEERAPRGLQAVLSDPAALRLALTLLGRVEPERMAAYLRRAGAEGVWEENLAELQQLLVMLSPLEMEGLVRIVRSIEQLKDYLRRNALFALLIAMLAIWIHSSIST